MPSAEAQQHHANDGERGGSEVAVPLPGPIFASSTAGASKTGVSIVDIDWSVDVLISSSEIARVAVPTVLLTLTLSDGQTRQYRLSQQDVHQWRFTLAKAVKNLSYLDNKAPPQTSKRAAKKQ